MAELIGLEVRNIGVIAKKLDRLIPEAQDAGAEMANDYLLNVFRTYPQYRYVSVQQAGGWRSDKQRRYVMMMIRKGVIKIPYRRTQTFARGWKQVGQGISSIVVNEVPYGPWLVDNERQSSAMRMRGWDKIALTLQDRVGEIARRFDAGVKQAIRKLGL